MTVNQKVYLFTWGSDRVFPDDFIENTTTESENEEVGIDFLFDYETGQHIMKNADITECTTLQGVQQYIQNVLRTQANAYGVYVEGETDVFGISIYEHLGKRTLPMGYINSELKREVTENLLKNPLISNVSNWVGKREKRGLNISFTVTLTDGSVLETSENVGWLNV